MAFGTLTLAGQSLAAPQSYKSTRTYRGGTSVMADGSLVTDLVSTTVKRIWVIGWELLTDAQRTTLETAFDALKDATGTFVDKDGTSYTVTLDEGAPELECEAVKAAGNNQRWRASITLRQV